MLATFRNPLRDLTNVRGCRVESAFNARGFVLYREDWIPRFREVRRRPEDWCRGAAVRGAQTRTSPSMVSASSTANTSKLSISVA
jgi:hypothetical protein